MKLSIISSLILVIGVVSCAPKTQESDQSVVLNQVTPIYLSPETDTILIGDHLSFPVTADSVVSSEGRSFDISDDRKAFKWGGFDEMPPLTNMSVYHDAGKVSDIPVFRSTAERVDFILPDPDRKYRSVKIRGAFNGWVADRSVMEFNDGNWIYSAIFYPGNHQYLMLVDGVETTDPSNPNTVSNGMGGTNSYVKVGKERGKNTLFPAGIQEERVTLRSEQPLLKLFVYLNDRLLADTAISYRDNMYEFKVPEVKGEATKTSFLRIYGYDQDGVVNDLLLPVKQGKVVTAATDLDRSDFHSQVLYFLMVDRFRDGDPNNNRKVENDTVLPIANYFGGDLKGVLDKIEDGYFSDLGINTIWLSPITQNPEGAYGLWKEPYTKFSGYHGYWPVSSTKVDDRFGDPEILKELISKAHSNGMNVILDYVANHVHKLHPVYKEHPDWATSLYLEDGTMNTERWDDHRLTTWFDTFLPTLDFSKPEVLESMTDSAAYWMTEYDFDGFRHDATKHIQTEFWRTLTEKIRKRTSRPVYQIGETYGSYDLIRSYVNAGMLDAQFDFNMYDASIPAFADKNSGFEGLAAAIEQSMAYYGSHHLMGNITGNQDRARFISYASGDIAFDEDAKIAGWTRDVEISDSTAYGNLEMLHAFNLVIPGVPCIYYGDEYGVPGGNDPDNRRQMKFDGLSSSEMELRNRVSELIEIRRSNMALLYGTTEIEVPEEKVLAIRRKYLENEVVAVFNKKDTLFKTKVFGVPVEVGPFDYTLIIKN
ncbi:alpha-amylase family glycosyl hydrolase [Robertkochia solimangrovi]|uniref:alpha-amylase family glycosyl hydrolase n=1 Tax=Robertkochia solimangrovi TaxID=2213046 RepID=UPI00117F64E5|nr:alpha-amylase family glycosyl hydrolase [Robertkochia solimangrovi]TRZ43294.1 alpha-amlyase [Robertkochia solimangrovi]